MVPIAPDHVANILISPVNKSLVLVVELPSGNRFDGQQSQFVAGIQYGRILRIVSQAYHVESVHADLIHVPVLCLVGDGIADIRIFLMPVGSFQFQRFSVDNESFFTAHFETADADACFFRIGDVFAVSDFCTQDVE